MHRVDILSVKDRGFLSRKPTVSSSSRISGALSIRQKNQKPQALGVKILPTFTIPPPPTQPAPKKKSEQEEMALSSNHNIEQFMLSGNHQKERLPQVNWNYGETDDSQDYNHLESPTGLDFTSYKADYTNRQRAFTQVSLQQGQLNRDVGNETSSRIPRPAYNERHRAFDEFQASLHQERPTRDGEFQRRSRSRSNGYRLTAQVSTPKEQQRARDLTDSYSKSPIASNSSVVVAQPGASQLRQLGQNVFVMSVVEGEAGTKSSGKQPPPRPAKSTGRSFFGSKRNQKKVSAQYEAVVGQKAEAKPEKKSFFNFKFPFGKGRVKELRAKMEQTTNAPQATEKVPEKPLPKPKRSPPSVKPKTYLAPPKERAPPPKERAPPPPSEPAPPPPTESRTSPYRHMDKESKTSPYPQGTTESRTSSYHQGATESKTRTAPYHKTAIPKPYHLPKPKDNSSPSKIPPPTAPKTYVSKYLPRRTKATPAEVAAVNSSMSLYECEDYLVPIRTQPTCDPNGSAGEEVDPPSPNAVPTVPVTYPKVQASFTSKKVTASSTLSLDSIAEAEEHEEKSPSPTAAEPQLSKLAPPTKEEDRLPSPKIVSPGLAGRYNRLEPLSTLTNLNSVSNQMPALAGSSISLDSVLQDNAPSSSKSQLPSVMVPTFRQESIRSQLLTSDTTQGSLAESSVSSMSLDSILEEFSKIGAPLASGGEEDAHLDLATTKPEISTTDGEIGSDSNAQKPFFSISDREVSLNMATSKVEGSQSRVGQTIKNVTSSKDITPPKPPVSNSYGEVSIQMATSNSELPQKSTNSGRKMINDIKPVTPQKPSSDGDMSLNFVQSKLRAPRKTLSSTSDGETGSNWALSSAKPPLKPRSSISDGETRQTLAVSRLKAPRKPLSSTSDGESRSNLALTSVKPPLKPLSSISDGETRQSLAVSRLKAPRKPLSSTSDGESRPNFTPSKPPLQPLSSISDGEARSKLASSRFRAPLQPLVSISDGDSTSNQEERKIAAHVKKQAPIPKPRRKSRHREHLPSNSELTSSVPAPVPPNLMKLKSLTNSADNLVEGVAARGTSDHGHGNGLRRPSVASNRTHSRDSPTPMDKPQKVYTV